MNLASYRLGRLLHPVASRIRILAGIDLSGFFDESGTHAQSRVIVIGGLVKPAVDWEPIEKEWKQALKDNGDPRFYHTTDIESFPPSGIYKGWTREQADRLTDAIIPIAAKITDDAVGLWISSDDWYAAADFLTSLLTNKPHRFPYEILTKACLDLVVVERATSLPTGEAVSFVFEDNDYSRAVLDGYKLVKHLHPMRERLGPLAFEPDKSRWAALQAADLFAWHYRRLNEIRCGYRQGQIHRHAKALFPPSSRGIYRQMEQPTIREILTEAIKRIS